MRPLCYFLHDHWDNNKQQLSWVIAPWWFFVSLWRICITFIWPRSSLKLKAPSSQSERHLHFLSIRLCLALLFIISIIINPNVTIMCWNDELSWLFTNRVRATGYLKVKRMETTEFLRKVWLFSANKIKKTLNHLVNNQLNSSLRHIIVTINSR